MFYRPEEGQGSIGALSQTLGLAPKPGAACRHCMALALANLDAVVLEARGALEGLPAHLLESMEALQKVIFNGAYYRLIHTGTLVLKVHAPGCQTN